MATRGIVDPDLYATQDRQIKERIREIETVLAATPAIPALAAIQETRGMLVRLQDQITTIATTDPSRLPIVLHALHARFHLRSRDVEVILPDHLVAYFGALHT